MPASTGDDPRELHGHAVSRHAGDRRVVGLVIGAGESCPVTPPARSSRCAVSATRTSEAFALDCRSLGDVERVHPESATSPQAAFRCVVPDGALTGTITR